MPINKYLFISILLSIITFLASAQNQKPLNIAIGYGNFKGGYFAIAKQYHKRNIGTLGIGCGKVLNNNQSYITLFANHTIEFNFSPYTKAKYYKWGVGVSIVYWRFEDEYYKWNVSSFIPSFERKFQLKPNLNLKINAGAAFQLVLKSERKTFEEVGWPYKIKPNASIQLNYVL